MAETSTIVATTGTTARNVPPHGREQPGPGRLPVAGHVRAVATVDQGIPVIGRAPHARLPRPAHVFDVLAVLERLVEGPDALEQAAVEQEDRHHGAADVLAVHP